MRRLGVTIAGIALIVGACTTVGSDDSEQAAPTTAVTSTASSSAPPSTAPTPTPPTTAPSPDPTIAPPSTTATTTPTSTTTPSRPATPSTTTTEPEPVLTEPAAAPDSFSASVVGPVPIVIAPDAQDVEISVSVQFSPAGYCETLFFLVTCGWDFHENPTWDGSTFTSENVSTFTATETLPFPSSEGDAKLFYFTYGYGEFLGFGDTGNQTISILVKRESDTGTR